MGCSKGSILDPILCNLISKEMFLMVNTVSTASYTDDKAFYRG